MKPILCLDFDGVIHRYSKGWQDGEIYDGVTDGFFEWLMKAQERFMVQVYSSRSRTPAGIAAMSIWLAEQAQQWRAKTKQELLLNLSFAHEKPSAFLTIDDRAIQFDGDWSKLDPTELRAFKPWCAS